MQNKRSLLLFLCALVWCGAGLWAQDAHASHFRSGQLNYNTRTVAGGIEVTVTLTVVQRRTAHCSSTSATAGGATSSCCSGSCLNRFTRLTGGTFTWGAGGGLAAQNIATGNTQMRIINDDPTNNAITMQADLKRTYPASTTTTTAQWGSCCWISGIQPPISSYSLNIVIQVNSGNRDPVFNSPELVEVCNGQTNNYNFTFNLNPSDPDGDTFTVAYIPACTTSGCGDVSQRGLSISSSGIINWPNPGPNATYVVKVRATDARGATTYREFLLRVSTCNNKTPTINLSRASQTINVGQTASTNVTGQDADATNRLTFRITPYPTGSSTNPTNARDINRTNPYTFTYNFQAQPADEGKTINVLFTVTDNGTPTLSAQKTFAVTVRNQDPTIALSPTGPTKTVAENATLTFSATASDNGVLDTMTATGVPSFCTQQRQGFKITFTCKPGFSDGGKSYKITITAKDKAGNTKTQEVTIVVTNNNRPPTLTNPGDQTVDAGKPLTFSITGADPDGDTITWTITGRPSGAVITGTNTKVFAWTPGFTQAGTYNVTFTVKDNGTPSLSTTRTIKITVNSVNRKPDLTNPGNFTIDEGKKLVFTITGSDPDNDTLTWNITGTPSGASVTGGNTKTFTWTPSFTQAGTYTVVFAITDNGTPKLGASRTVIITVRNVNRAPSFTSTAPTTAISEQPYSYSAKATDPDTGDKLTFKKLKGPAGSTVNSTTGEVTWTPGPNDIGKTFDFEIEVCDDGTPQQCAKQAWKVKVEKPNAPPQIVGTPPTALQEGQTLTYSPTVTDKDLPNDTHTWKLLKGPTSATIDSATGKITWTAGASDVGKDIEFSIQVCDKGGSCAVQTWKVRVTKGNNPPIITTAPGTTASVGNIYNYKAAAMDADPGDTHTWKLNKGPSTASVDPKTGELFWTPAAGDAGNTVEFEVQVCDQAGACAVQNWKVKVADGNDPPTITGTPGTKATAGQGYNYKPTATDPNTGDKLTWSKKTGPTGLTVDNTTGEVNWTPGTANDNKEHDVSIEVCDQKGACATQSWKIRVGTGNAPPAIDGVPSGTAEEEKPYTYEPKVNDPDSNDTHTWKSGKLPTGASIDPKTGKVTWTPPKGSGGKTFDFEAEVCDSSGSCAKIAWKVKVKDKNNNTPPVITSVPSNTATATKPYNYDIKIKDPDTGDTHTYTLDKGPTGMKVDGTTGKLTWTPGTADVGKTFDVTVKVCDKAGDCASQSWKIKVEQGNHPPQIDGAPSNFASTKQDYEYNPSVSDPDTDDQGKHTWKVKNGPSSATIDPKTGALKWKPGKSDVGKRVTFTVEVCDPAGACAERTWEVLVTEGDINNPPLITSTPGTTASAGVGYNYKPTAVDPDPNDTHTWKLTKGPAGASIDAQTGEINWTPSGADVGQSVSFEVEVCDNNGACDTQTWTVGVGKGNQAPTITSTPPTEAYVGEKMSYKAKATDADTGDKHTWTLLKGPAGATVDPQTGEVSWTPASGDALKEREFTVLVCDDAVPKACATQTFKVKVFNKCTLDSDCPTDEVCIEGKCLPPGCAPNTPKCPQSQFCKDTACMPNQCDGKTCGAGEICRPSDGKCIKPCAGVKCNAGEVCVDGTCETDPCATAGANGGPCASDEVCDTSDAQNPKCVKDPCGSGTCKHGRVCTKGKCIDDPCPGMTCPSADQRCLAGQCTDRQPCQVDVDCEGQQVCLNGKCYPEGCYDSGAACSAPETCQAGTCKKDACDGKSCVTGRFCREGKCVDSCAGVSCKDNETCLDGACVTDPCAGIKCNAGEVCVEGTCEKERCNASGVCKFNRVCDPVANECTDDPCKNIQCPDSKQVCERGQCQNPPECKFDKDCPGNQLCVNKKCISPQCNATDKKCGPDEICDDGECAGDPCKGVTCQGNEYCKGGKCVGSCAGVFCPTGEQCVDGTCVADPCADKQCPGGEVCVSGTCEKNPCESDSCKGGRVCQPDQGGRCTEDPCSGVTCPGGSTCNNGQCSGDRSCKVDADCPGDAICDSGKCKEKGCYDGKCADGELCIAGQCVKNACSDKQCGNNETCRPTDGNCTKNCPTCPSGKTCNRGSCQDDPCADVTCKDGEICVAGTCTADPCKSDSGKLCKFTRVCNKGTCEDDPCTGVKCAEDQTCRAGVCVGGTNNTENNGEQTNGEQTNTDGGTGNDGDSNDKVFNISGGCGCSSNHGNGAPFVILLLLAVGLVFRRRQQA